MASDPGWHRRALKGLAHELGNLAYRLTFLSSSLKAQIPDPSHRDEAVALLKDTSDRLQQAIERLREVEKRV